MTSIKNTPAMNDAHLQDVRKAFEHRATWMYLLIKAAKEKGLGWSFARDGIFECGCIHGQRIADGMKNIGDMQEFQQNFAADISQHVFEMEVVAADERKYYLDFHYCPLVEAWQKLGICDEDVDKLCDIAMDGDRGIASQFPAFAFSLGETIAQGKPVCQIRFDKK